MKGTSTTLIGVGICSLVLSVTGTVEAADMPGAGSVNYGRPFEPPTRPAFLRCRPARWNRGLAARLVPGGAGRVHRPHGRVPRGVPARVGRRSQDDRRTACTGPKEPGRTKAADTGSTAWSAWAMSCTTTR